MLFVALLKVPIHLSSDSYDMLLECVDGESYNVFLCNLTEQLEAIIGRLSCVFRLGNGGECCSKPDQLLCLGNWLNIGADQNLRSIRRR